jgi:hypothetical protein
MKRGTILVEGQSPFGKAKAGVPRRSSKRGWSDAMVSPASLSAMPRQSSFAAAFRTKTGRDDSPPAEFVKKTPGSFCRVSLLAWVMVGTTGFEPATPASRTRCSTRLSHVPTQWEYILWKIDRQAQISLMKSVGIVQKCLHGTPRTREGLGPFLAFQGRQAAKSPGLVFSTAYLRGSSAPSRCSPRLRSGPGVSPIDKP